ncbi:hypothetical protein IJM86_02770 [bacterium]|nr:hypothetical protein [bacterium]
MRIPISSLAEGKKKNDIMTEESKKHRNNTKFFDSSQKVKSEEYPKKRITLKRDV